MALRAGYKGIKKKYADEINRGEGGGGGGGSGAIEFLAGFENVATATPLTSIDISEYIDNYDVIVLNSMFYQSGAVTAIVSNSIPVSVLKQLTGSSILAPHWLIAMNPHTDTWERIQYDNGVLRIFNSPAGVGIFNAYGVKF